MDSSPFRHRLALLNDLSGAQVDPPAADLASSSPAGTRAIHSATRALTSSTSQARRGAAQVCVDHEPATRDGQVRAFDQRRRCDTGGPEHRAGRQGAAVGQGLAPLAGRMVPSGDRWPFLRRVPPSFPSRSAVVAGRARPGERVTVARAEAPSGTGGALG